MKISARYTKRLESYLEWAKCTTPFTGSYAEGVAGLKSRTPASTDSNALTAAEWMMRRESLGKVGAGCCEPDLLDAYRRGKAMRDWWNKDIGWWNKHAPRYIQEEFVSHLTPECFAELFGRWPRTHLVRQLHDNHYSQEEFERDAERFFGLGLEREQGGWRYYGGA